MLFKVGIQFWPHARYDAIVIAAAAIVANEGVMPSRHRPNGVVPSANGRNGETLLAYQTMIAGLVGHGANLGRVGRMTNAPAEGSYCYYKMDLIWKNGIYRKCAP